MKPFYWMAAALLCSGAGGEAASAWGNRWGGHGPHPHYRFPAVSGHYGGTAWQGWNAPEWVGERIEFRRGDPYGRYGWQRVPGWRPRGRVVRASVAPAYSPYVYPYAYSGWYNYPAYGAVGETVSFNEVVDPGSAGWEAAYTARPVRVARRAVAQPLATCDLPPAVAERNGVMQVQWALRERGYYRGAVDGIYGPQTRRAVRLFQRENGLRPTGRLDGRSRMLLF